MVLERQFVSAHVTELLEIWQVTVIYSYYGLYNFNVTYIESSLEKALYRLLIERCGTRLRIVDKAGVNINVADLDK